MPRSTGRTIAVLTAMIGLAAGVAVAAPAPRGIVTINRSVVQLQDLFSDAGPKADDVLGPAPAPGQRINVGAAQLSAIARAYGVGWTGSGPDNVVVIERPGVPVRAAAITHVLRPALLGAGAPDHFVVQLGSDRLPMIPPGALPDIVVNNIRYDQVNGQFAASLLISATGMKPESFDITGIAAPAERVIVARRTLQPGDVVTLGMQISRRLAAGTPLSRQTMARVMMVTRGATVSLAVETPGLEVTAEGVALASGPEGAVIPVLNPSSREVVQAVVDGQNHAHVIPGSHPTPQNGTVPYYSRMVGQNG
ncbi:MAG: flagella basal body P-ring formation protein FlgA [Acidiphilium sp. 21-68-69]|nr:MAG: flagella basal body P-ring formation protein FlgA [Acidiphilium sp. 21-68-69]